MGELARPRRLHARYRAGAGAGRNEGGKVAVPVVAAMMCQCRCGTTVAQRGQVDLGGLPAAGAAPARPAPRPPCSAGARRQRGPRTRPHARSRRRGRRQESPPRPAHGSARRFSCLARRAGRPVAWHSTAAYGVIQQHPLDAAGVGALHELGQPVVAQGFGWHISITM